MSERIEVNTELAGTWHVGCSLLEGHHDCQSRVPIVLREMIKAVFGEQRLRLRPNGPGFAGTHCLTVNGNNRLKLLR